MLPLLFEFIGSLIFFYVILTVGQPIAVGAAFLGVVFFGANVSGAHYNPAVTFMTWLAGNIENSKAVQYVIMQTLAAISVIYLKNQNAIVPAIN